MIAKNGKEMPHASFNKFSSHKFLQMLRAGEPDLLVKYATADDIERNHRFWQRDPLAVLIDSKAKFEQKPDYIHLNPLQEYWNFAD